VWESWTLAESKKNKVDIRQNDSIIQLATSALLLAGKDASIFLWTFYYFNQPMPISY
jgi:hypothetical protein